ncbi:hypothetical protein M8818_000639 [Zalaria obscura]|uniref:Uncharacterized protein n=1 Tax=Zalaria obscura TaxID=2024903 RepID=A0ACC3SNW0_9PEZI
MGICCWRKFGFTPPAVVKEAPLSLCANFAEDGGDRTAALRIGSLKSKVCSGSPFLSSQTSLKPDLLVYRDGSIILGVLLRVAPVAFLTPDGFIGVPGAEFFAANCCLRRLGDCSGGSREDWRCGDGAPPRLRKTMPFAPAPQLLQPSLRVSGESCPRNRRPHRALHQAQVSLNTPERIRFSLSWVVQSRCCSSSQSPFFEIRCRQRRSRLCLCIAQRDRHRRYSTRALYSVTGSDVQARDEYAPSVKLCSEDNDHNENAYTYGCFSEGNCGLVSQPPHGSRHTFLRLPKLGNVEYNARVMRRIKALLVSRPLGEAVFEIRIGCRGLSRETDETNSSISHMDMGDSQRIYAMMSGRILKSINTDHDEMLIEVHLMKRNRPNEGIGVLDDFEDFKSHSGATG